MHLEMIQKISQIKKLVESLNVYIMIEVKIFAALYGWIQVFN